MGNVVLVRSFFCKRITRPRVALWISPRPDAVTTPTTRSKVVLQRDLWRLSTTHLVSHDGSTTPGLCGGHPLRSRWQK